MCIMLTEFYLIRAYKQHQCTGSKRSSLGLKHTKEQYQNQMSSSQLELIRLNHELVEKYELAVGDELDVKPNGVSKYSVFSPLQILQS